MPPGRNKELHVRETECIVSAKVKQNYKNYKNKEELTTITQLNYIKLDEGKQSGININQKNPVKT